MSLVINNNLMAMNAARNLSQAYSSLALSTNRLSSGLRITSAADDAAGLAIRELMRADLNTTSLKLWMACATLICLLFDWSRK